MTEVVCVGLATLDVIQRVDALPDAGRKGWATATELAAGGPAANAAVTAARLLGSATLVTALGSDAAADAARADLEAHGVRVVDLDPTAECVVASCLVTPDGERTVVSPGARTSTTGLTDEARAVVAAAEVLLLDGHHPEAAEAALDLAGGIRVLDAGSAKPRAEGWLSRLDVVAGSADYARALGLDLAAAARHCLDAGAGAAVMTDGPADAVWASSHGSGRSTPPAATAVDTLGAGDAFHGALAAALSRRMPLGEAVELACAVAAARVGTAGARAWLDDIRPLVSHLT